MEGTPHYTADSFIPIFNSSNDPQPSNSRRSIIYDPDFFKRSKHHQNSPQSADNSDPYPWKKTAVYTCGIVGLHEEIEDFYKTMSATPEESEIRLKVIEHITKIIHSLWPQAEVEIFGSFRTGLYLPSSDIDMVVVGEWKNVPLSTLSEALVRNGIKREDITAIPQATVPIVRMVHTPSQIHVDVSFNISSGVQTSKFIKKLIKEHPPLSRLVLVLKQFLIHRGLNEVYKGGMGSYCLTLLVVSFLQGFHKPKTAPSTNLGTLLMEFFEHYGLNFNYEHVSIHFDNGGKYRPRTREIGSSYLYVEDPLVAGKDIGKGTYLMHSLKNSFQNAFHLLHKTVIENMQKKRSAPSYLELILKVDSKVIDNRNWTQENYSNILRSISKLLKKLNSDEESSRGTKKKKKKLNNTSFDGDM